MVPAELVQSAVSVNADAPTQLLDFRDQLLA
jgi:hypothetical protein